MTSQTDLTQRIATSSAEAAAGYATAAVAAYVDFTSQVVGYWANAMDSMMGKAEPRSWYRHPDSLERSPPLAMTGFAWMPFVPNFAAPGASGANVLAANFNPFNLWMKAWPLQGNPVAWPMAFMLMGMGMSRSVAYPLAEANTAAMDVVHTAVQAADETFSRYRSDSGHATAQIRIKSSKAIATTVMMPIGLQVFAPWLHAFATQPRTY